MRQNEGSSKSQVHVPSACNKETFRSYVSNLATYLKVLGQQKEMIPQMNQWQKIIKLGTESNDKETNNKTKNQ